jgi:hypothetical protein
MMMLGMAQIANHQLPGKLPIFLSLGSLSAEVDMVT